MHSGHNIWTTSRMRTIISAAWCILVIAMPFYENLLQFNKKHKILGFYNDDEDAEEVFFDDEDVPFIISNLGFRKEVVPMIEAQARAMNASTDLLNQLLETQTTIDEQKDLIESLRLRIKNLETDNPTCSHDWKLEKPEEGNCI